MNTDEEYVPEKAKKYCVVRACKNNSEKDATKSFFPLPSSNKKEWCNAIGIGCPKRYIYICEDHLNLEEDLENYQYWKTMKGRPKLKRRLPQSLVQTPSVLIQKIDEPSPSTSSSFMDDDMDTYTTKCNIGIQVKPKTENRQTYCDIKNAKIKPQQKEKEDKVLTESILKDDAFPSTEGSTTSAHISDESSDVCVETKNKMESFMLHLIQRKPQNYIGLPKKYYWLINYLETELKIKSFNIIITLYKIKNNTPFYQIADMFEVSLTTLWIAFFRTLCILSMFFKQLIFSPNVFHIKRNLPGSFITNKEYSNVFCIIDCFEIEIEKPSNPNDQSLTWSQYKNANTLKYLVGITPDGFVNFVSAGFGGRISDVSMVESSGFMDVIPSNCTILADRGFKHIDTLLSKKNIKLLRPPCVSKDTKLRIHVERVIRRIRLFKFLKPHSVINNKLIQHTDEIVIVACGLVNLQESIIKHD